MTTEEQLENKLKEQLAILTKEKEENERLRYELTINSKLIEHLQKATKPVYVSREKKLNKFSGRPIKDSDLSVSDWIEDAREHLSTISDEKIKVEFLLEHLNGAAKDELRVRQKHEKDTAEKILKLIQNIYDEVESVSQLQQRFFQRNQKSGESLEEYSLALMKIANQATKRDDSALGDKNNTLKERFIEGILDKQLKREVRRFYREHKEYSFLQFREEVLKWVDELGETLNSKTCQQEVQEVSENAMKSEHKDDLSEIKKLLLQQQTLLEQQQKQIDTLSKQHLKTVNNNYSNPSRSVLGTHRGQDDVTCFGCGGFGHRKSNCPSPSAGRYHHQRSRNSTRFRGRGRGHFQGQRSSNFEYNNEYNNNSARKNDTTSQPKEELSMERVTR